MAYYAVETKQIQAIQPDYLNHSHSTGLEIFTTGF